MVRLQSIASMTGVLGQKTCCPLQVLCVLKLLKILMLFLDNPKTPWKQA